MPYYEFLCPVGHKTELQLSFKGYEELPQIENERYIVCPPPCGYVASRMYDAAAFDVGEGKTRTP